MWNMVWPVLLVVFSNTFYNICQKSTPEDANPFIALTMTYLVAAAASAGIFFATAGTHDVLGQIRKLNWTTVVLGFAIIGLEAGVISSGEQRPFLQDSIISRAVSTISFLPPYAIAMWTKYRS